jgi:ferredoxin
VAAALHLHLPGPATALPSRRSSGGGNGALPPQGQLHVPPLYHAASGHNPRATRKNTVSAAVSISPLRAVKLRSVPCVVCGRCVRSCPAGDSIPKREGSGGRAPRAPGADREKLMSANLAACKAEILSSRRRPLPRPGHQDFPLRMVPAGILDFMPGQFVERDRGKGSGRRLRFRLHPLGKGYVEGSHQRTER